MTKYFFLFLVLCACDFPIPDAGCAVVTKNGNVVHVEYCDAGVAGSAGVGAGGSGGTSPVVDAGAGAGGGTAGTAGGHVHPAAGVGGSEPADAGMHLHGGLPVALPLPASKPGRTDEYFVRAGSVPKKDAGGIGAARTRCYTSHFNFDDAIVYPGMPDKAHLHMYAGADHVDENGIAPSSGGTCRGGAANLSAYWMPGLLTPEGKAIVADYFDIYYKQGNYDISGPPTNFVPQPKGLKLIAGDMTARPETPQSRNRVGWTCGDSDGTAQSAGLPANCTNPSFHIHFPYCWNGVDLDSADHKSHLAYPSGGKCPAGYSVLIPAISYHVYFHNVPAGSRLSCDAATGQGGFCGHADLISNWDEDVMNSMVRACVNTGLSCGSDLVGDGRSLGIFGN